jgi:dTDP-4-amino-4,6-dideoxygalactose transaminase
MKLYEPVDAFEKCVAKYCGATYGVAVDSCTNALFLSLFYYETPKRKQKIVLPNRTYPSVPCSVIHAGYEIDFKDLAWSRAYRLAPSIIYDCAQGFSKDCHIPGNVTCVSFSYTKPIPIGKGGMILTDSKELYDWARVARYSGRLPEELSEDSIVQLGWNMYMTPDQAARGLMLMATAKDYYESSKTWIDYPDLSQKKFYRRA